MSKRKSSVWVVIHCEYFQRRSKPDSKVLPVTDEMVFHVAGSRRAAERRIQATFVIAHSWWKIERRVVDEPDSDADDSPETYFYNHRGKPQSSAPHSTALRLFKSGKRKKHADRDRRKRRSVYNMCTNAAHTD